jgi:uncharacterized peroxidase-related enzyme
MSRIPALPLENAAGQVKTMLDAVHRGLGVTPNMFRVAAQSPAALEALTSFFGATSKGRLDAKQREAIALAVSEAHRCDYCLSAHSALGKGAGLDETELAKAREGAADDAELAAMLRFARTVVEKRGRCEDHDLAELRRAGVSDGAIVEIVANVALTTFTNYLNEIAQTDIDFPRVTHRPR